MDSLFKFSLSANGYKNINFSSLPYDFTFVVNGDSYHTNRVIADFLSPLISKTHVSDPTFSSYVINLQNVGNFNDIIKLGQLKEFQITIDNVKFVKEVFEKLGNVSFYDNFEAYYDHTINDNANSFDIYDYVNKIIIKEKLGSTNLSKEISFISQRFYEIDKNTELISKLTPTLLEDILRSPKLCITSEDTLVDLLLTLGSSYFHLFEYVHFSEITPKIYKKFIDAFDINFLNESIWKTINNRIYSEKNKENEEFNFSSIEEEIEINEKRYKKKKEMIKNFENDGFNNNGIISHLTQVGQGNPHRRKLMDVTSSSVYLYHFPESCLDLMEDTYFASDDFNNQWILFDFKHNEIIPSFYLIRSQYDYVNNLKSWMIEGSIDGNEWTIMDKRLGVDCLKEKNVIARFSIQKPMRCRFVRLTQLGNNWNDNNFLIISGIEFFGKFISYI